MAATTKPDTAPSPEEVKIIHALENRGLLTRDDYARLRKENPHAYHNLAADALLGKLVEAGLITRTQAQRIGPDLPALLSQQIPGYQFISKLGQGQMGTVIKARQLSMDRLVAVKILHQKLAANQDFIERFFREAHLAAKFSSNNVIQAIDVGSAGPLHYFVMEYVEGTTLKDELEKGKIYGEKEAIEIIVQIAEALNHAHRRNLIHRDIKPANIVITKDGVAKLADLGLARATSDQALAKAEKGMTIGTPYYMAPEQVRSREDVDSRADIYSLGATLYHMVTGRPPFNYPKVQEVLRAHLEEPLEPVDQINPKLSSGLAEVIEFMMAKKRTQRYPTPEGVILDLECLLRDEPPRVARKKVDASMLAELAEGEVEKEERPEKEEEGTLNELVPIWWVYALGGGLVVSLLLNLFLALK